MYVYLDFSSANFRGSFNSGSIGATTFFFVISLHILSANVQFSSSLFGGLACIAPTSRWCRSVAIPKYARGNFSVVAAQQNYNCFKTIRWFVIIVLKSSLQSLVIVMV